MTEIRDILDSTVLAFQNHELVEKHKDRAEAQINAIIKQAKIDVYKECEYIFKRESVTTWLPSGANALRLVKKCIVSKRLELEQLKDGE